MISRLRNFYFPVQFPRFCRKDRINTVLPAEKEQKYGSIAVNRLKDEHLPHL